MEPMGKLQVTHLDFSQAPPPWQATFGVADVGFRGVHPREKLCASVSDAKDPIETLNSTTNLSL